MEAAAADVALDDAAVIERSWVEPERFALVFDRYYAELYRYVGRRLGPDLAEDVAAEAFLVAFKARIRYDVTRSDARPWLYGIVSKLVADQHRAEGRRYRLVAHAGLADRQVAGHAEDVAAQVDAQAVGGRLAEVLAGIPERERAVLLLVAWAGLNCEQAAQALDIRPGTARSRLHRARKTLRAAFGGTNPTHIGKDTD